MTKNESIYTDCQARIKGPGKFEGEPIYSPYFYDLLQDGASDNTNYTPSGTRYDDFTIENVDKGIFPELSDVLMVRCSEDNNGFFYCTALTDNSKPSEG